MPACPAGPVQSIGGDVIEKAATMTTTRRGEGYRDVASDYVYAIDLY